VTKPDHRSSSPRVTHPLLAATPLLMALSTLGCSAASTAEDYGEQSAALTVTKPTTAERVSISPSTELDSLESEGHQGIAACPNYWFWTSTTKIMRVPRGGSLTSPLQGVVEDVPGPFKKMGYDHFGDGECFAGRFFVALTAGGGNLDPVVLEYGEDLSLRAFARTGSALVAVNPRDGMLYAQKGTTLRVYNRSLMRRYRWDPTTCDYACWKESEYDVSKLTELGSIRLLPRFNPDWWREGESGLWVQGGAFSSNGVYYMTVDHGGLNPSDLTGSHAFAVAPFTFADAPALVISGVGASGILPVWYTPQIVVPAVGIPPTTVKRLDELEGITVYSLAGESQHHVQMTLLRNQADDDDVSVHHFTTNETPRADVNDYWAQLPMIW